MGRSDLSTNLIYTHVVGVYERRVVVIWPDPIPYVSRRDRKQFLEVPLIFKIFIIKVTLGNLTGTIS